MGHEVFLFFVWEGTKDICGTSKLFLLNGVIGKQDQIPKGDYLLKIKESRLSHYMSELPRTKHRIHIRHNFKAYGNMIVGLISMRIDTGASLPLIMLTLS
jgi:hypothetical protein